MQVHLKWIDNRNIWLEKSSETSEYIQKFGTRRNIYIFLFLIKLNSILILTIKKVMFL